MRPAQLAAARVLPAAPLVSTPPGSVGRPPARRCRCPSGCPTLPRAAVARRPLARRLLRPGHTTPPPTPSTGEDRPEARGRQRGGLLGGGGLGSGRKLREERLRRWHGRHPPRPGVPGLAVRTTARLQPSPAGRSRSQHHAVNPARLSSRPPPHRAPGESRTASLALLEQPRLAERSLNSVQITRLTVVGGASRRRCRLSGFSKRSRTEGSLG